MNAPAGKITPQTLIGALASALPKLEAAKKKKNNPAFKSKYADLGSILEAIEPITEDGLWYRQSSHEAADGVSVETFYIHISGAELSAGTLFMPADKKNAQGFGSALTYARRYALQLAFGLTTEDDDGNAASRGAAHSGTSDDTAGERKMSAAGPATFSRDSGQTQGMPDTEYNKIVQLLKATHSDAGPMLKHYGVQNIRQLNQDQFADAVATLNDKLARTAREESNARAATDFGKELNDVIQY